MGMNTISNNSLVFKSVIITNEGRDFIQKNANRDEVALLSEMETKCKDFHWNLIVNKDGYILQSPTGKREFYSEPFSIKKHRKIDKDKNLKEQLIIRTGIKNRNKFIINFPSRKNVMEIYKSIKNNSGLSKIVMIFELLESNLLLQKANTKLRKSLKKVV